MKNLLILGIVGIAVYFLFFNSPFKKDFYFNGQEYSHAKEKSGGDVQNHFYTMNGDKAEYAKTFIHILELTEHTQKSDWPVHLKSVLTQFHLKPFKNRDSEYIGNINRTGTYQNVFAAPIRVKEHDHMILFVTTGTEEDKPSTAEKKAILDELKSLETIFN